MCTVSTPPVLQRYDRGVAPRCRIFHPLEKMEISKIARKTKWTFGKSKAPIRITLRETYLRYLFSVSAFKLFAATTFTVSAFCISI